MKQSRLYTLIFILSYLTGGLQASTLYNYGLYFKSHAVSGVERTSLYLDDNHPFPIKESFTVSFQLYVRDYEPDFGSILHLQTNTGQLIRLSFVAGKESHFPALVLNEGIVTIDTPIQRNKWLNISVQLRVKDNVAEVDYNGKRTSAMVPLQETVAVTALFGRMPDYLADVAPVNLKDVNVAIDGKTVREWKLWKYNDTICYDEKQGAIARAVSPFWLIDNHIEWKPIYQHKIPGKLDIAFNAREALFYLVKPQGIEILDQNGMPQQEIEIQSGYPAMEYPNHLLYDTLTNKLVSYSLKENKVAYFSFETGTWNNNERSETEPYYYNHARAFNSADSSFYFFGGYGFYQYRDELFRLKSGENKVEQIEYEHSFYPRYSAAMAIVGDELYIFGGRGNKYGKQELPSNYYFSLWAVNFKTNQSRLVWENDKFKENTLMASSMYFESSDSSFYAVSMSNGGTLWKISMKDSVYKEVSKPIHNESIYQDLDLCLYASPAHEKLFLVMDKILSNHTHDVSIYSINLPLVDELDIRQSVHEVVSGRHWYVYVAGFLFFVIAGVVFFYLKQYGKRKENLSGEAVMVGEKQEMQIQTKPLDKQSNTKENIKSEIEPISLSEFNYYDRSRASISLLGSFNVRDKEGNDITASFTSRLKHLLILLILSSEKNVQGILVSKITKILWPEKEETAARNNRNVTLRKLRVLLESIGDMEIVTEKNFLRIRWGKNVFCDYHEVFTCIRQTKEEFSAELHSRILELLLYGPLLPNTILTWLDDFKDAYSSHCIDLLKNLLKIEIKQNHQDMVIRLTDIMFRHDPLNEEALAAKCAILSAQGKKGIARNVYDRFCKEYHDSMGENYKIPFGDL